MSDFLAWVIDSAVCMIYGLLFYILPGQFVDVNALGVSMSMTQISRHRYGFGMEMRGLS